MAVLPILAINPYGFLAIAKRIYGISRQGSSKDLSEGAGRVLRETPGRGPLGVRGSLGAEIRWPPMDT